ncbi:hypothetical protein SALBM311S_03207 [Streptomyces alboniger]
MRLPQGQLPLLLGHRSRRPAGDVPGQQGVDTEHPPSAWTSRAVAWRYVASPSPRSARTGSSDTAAIAAVEAGEGCNGVMRAWQLSDGRGGWCDARAEPTAGGPVLARVRSPSTEGAQRRAIFGQVPNSYASRTSGQRFVVREGPGEVGQPVIQHATLGRAVGRDGQSAQIPVPGNPWRSPIAVRTSCGVPGFRACGLVAGRHRSIQPFSLPAYGRLLRGAKNHTAPAIARPRNAIGLVCSLGRRRL